MTTVGSPALNKAQLTKTQWQGLLACTNGPAFVRLAIHFGLILTFGALIQARVIFWPTLLLPQGLLLIFLFAPLHECIHRTAFRTNWCNDLAAHLCGWLVFLPPFWFRCFHLSHHRLTANPERDPELATAKPGNRRAYLIHLSGIPVWWSQMRQLLANAFGRNQDSFVPHKAHRRVTVEAVWFIALYAMAYELAGEQLLWLWIVPVLIGQPFLRGFLLAEHMGCALVPDMLANSRTTMTNKAMRCLCWNMSYHAEHHSQPAVPFHKLPAYHQHTKPYAQVIQDGYFDLHRRIFSELH